MLGRTHMLLGAAASIVIFKYLGYESNIVTIITASIAALIPDIDHPRSLINQKLLMYKNKMFKMLTYSGIGTFLLYINQEYQNLVLTLVGLLLIFIGAAHHRGFTHSIIGVLVISAVTTIAFFTVTGGGIIAAFVIGVLSHLIGDMFTREGVKLFYPFSKRNYCFPVVIATGGIMEYALLILLAILMLKDIGLISF